MLSDCLYLKVICLRDGCLVDLKKYVSDSVKVLPVAEVMSGDYFIQDLPQLREIVIPDGMEQIRNHLLYNCEVESVVIPASVREIGVRAFCNCRKLKEVVFQRTKAASMPPRDNSEDVRAPVPPPSENSMLRVIGMEVFRGCGGLKAVELPNGLEEIGVNAFNDSRLERITTLPPVRTVH